MGKPVDANDALYRRGFGPPDKRFLNPDGSATSRAFVPKAVDNGQLSVNVKSLTTALASILNNTDKYVLFEIDVIDVLAIPLFADHDPIEDNPAHALIYTIQEGDEITPGLLARKSRRVYMGM